MAGGSKPLRNFRPTLRSACGTFRRWVAGSSPCFASAGRCSRRWTRGQPVVGVTNFLLLFYSYIPIWALYSNVVRQMAPLRLYFLPPYAAAGIRTHVCWFALNQRVLLKDARPTELLRHSYFLLLKYFIRNQIKIRRYNLIKVTYLTDINEIIGNSNLT